MSKPKRTPASVAGEIRVMLKRGGSAEHATGVQWFFKEEVQSHGWYTPDLRRVANRARREIEKECDLHFVVQVAHKLFSGPVLEEKVFAVLMLEKLPARLGEEEFGLFDSWLDRICSWADHDSLVHYLIAPMIVAEPARLANVFQWATSPDRWHRRAACVALIQGTRRKLFRAQIRRLSTMLLQDEDDMVQKGLGWLLRETAKANATRTIPYLLRIRARAPRLVLRTACETRLLVTAHEFSDSDYNSGSLWTLPPFNLRCANATWTLGCSTITIIAIPSRIACSAFPKS